MADKTINQLTEDTTPTSGDFLASWDGATSTTKKVTMANAARVGSPSAGAQNATVVTSETTASTTFTDLATVGPSVTVTIGANGLALVTISLANTNNNVADNLAAVVVSGANTITASTNEGVGTWHYINDSTTQLLEMSYSRLFTGLTAGSTTFKLQYRVTVGIGTFIRRVLSVIPL